MYVHQVFGRCQWFGPKIQLASLIKGLTITPRLTVLRKREIIFSMALNTNQSISENWLHLVCDMPLPSRCSAQIACTCHTVHTFWVL